MGSISSHPRYFNLDILNNAQEVLSKTNKENLGGEVGTRVQLRQMPLRAIESY